MRLAVIIPTLDEEIGLEACLISIIEELHPDDLVVVADGGSVDATTAIAHRFGALVVAAPRGRGPQLERGAREAISSGADLLLFLHADSRVPRGLRQALETCRAPIGGGCLVDFRNPPRGLRAGTRLVNWRTEKFHWPLGDQGQFARADAYDRSGGFPAWPILEDVEFIRRLKEIGELTIVPLAISTDSRRFEQHGVVRTVVINWLIWLLFALGVSPHRLGSLYRNFR